MFLLFAFFKDLIDDGFTLMWWMVQGRRQVQVEVRLLLIGRGGDLSFSIETVISKKTAVYWAQLWSR